MLLASLAYVYNELNNKFHWNNKELDIFDFFCLDLLLLEVGSLVLYAYYEILPAIIEK